MNHVTPRPGRIEFSLDDNGELVLERYGESVIPGRCDLLSVTRLDLAPDVWGRLEDLARRGRKMAIAKR